MGGERPSYIFDINTKRGNPGRPRRLRGQIEDLQPVALTLKVTIEDIDGGSAWFGCDQIVGLTDATTGEIFDDPIGHLWEAWFDRQVKPDGSLPLAAAVEALPLMDIGPIKSKLISDRFNTWHEFWSSLCAMAADMERFRAKYRDLPGDALWAVARGDTWELERHFDLTDIEMPAPGEFPDLYNWSGIHGIGPVAVERLCVAATCPNVKAFIARHLAHRTIGSAARPQGQLKGHRIVFTGVLEAMTRAEARRAAEAAGAVVSGNISESVTLVIVGTSAGEKLRVAQRLGIDIVTEAEFMSLIQDGGNHARREAGK